MAKMWKNLWESMWGKWWETCGKKCGMSSLVAKDAKKWGVCKSFTQGFDEVLNKFFISVKAVVLHSFHIAYYYN